MEFSDDFAIAIKDYFDLLNKKYPQKAILGLVGSRYKLSRTERSVLYRGVSSKEKNLIRSEKLIDEIRVKEQFLHIDAFNQLLTIASYLNGNKVFVSTDGYLRDASEIHGKIFRFELLERSIELIRTYVVSLKFNGLVFFMDQQLDNYEKLKNFILGQFNEVQVEIVLSKIVDQELKKVSAGFIATSDSQIIEKTNLKIFDLAYHTLKYHFHPSFFDLKSLIHKKQ